MRYTRFDDHFAEFVDAAQVAKTKEQVFEAFTRAVGSLGYDRINLYIQYDADLSPLHYQYASHCTYPREWIDFYADENLGAVDPIPRYAIANSDPFQWRQIEQRGELSKSQIGVLRMAEEARLFNGVGIPFPGPNNQVAGVALASSIKSGLEIRSPFLLAAYGNHLYKSYKRVARQSEPRKAPIGILSKRQQLVLRHVADGACDKEVARRMGIAPHTVNHHFRQIFEKLNTNSRINAVVIAITHRLFSPDLLI